MEEFRDVKGYEGLYQVSSLGRVKSLKRKNVPVDRILNPVVGDVGYLMHCLSRDGKSKTKRVHQLVAEAFLNHTVNGYSLVVDHLDSNRLNNNLKNLQVVSNRENTSKRKGGSSRYNGVCWNKKSNKWIATIKINGKSKYLGIFTDELQAAEAYQTALKEIS